MGARRNCLSAHHFSTGALLHRLRLPSLLLTNCQQTETPSICICQECPPVRQRGWRSSRFQFAAHPENLHCKERHIDLRSSKRQSTNRTKATGTWLQSSAPLRTKLATSALTGVGEMWSTNIVPHPRQS